MGQRMAKIAPNYQTLEEAQKALLWRKCGPANTLAPDRWYPELWRPFLPRATHFAVAALQIITTEKYFNCVTVSGKFLRFSALFSKAF